MTEARKIRKEEVEDVLALTPLQEGLFFHYLKEPYSNMYCEELRLHLSGEISRVLFEKAWQQVVQANEMLRTVFRWEGVKHPVQIVLKQQPPRILFSEGEVIGDEEAYDLQKVPFSVELCRLGETEYEMILRHHHILFDGWSNGIILLEFMNAYRALVQGHSPTVPDKAKFKEFIRWLQSQDRSQQQHFWQTYLAGFEKPVPLSSTPSTGLAARTYTQFLSEDRSARIREFTSNQGITLATLFYAAWGVFLQRYQNSQDVLFGTTVSGRGGTFPGVKEMVGLFINTPPLRVTHREGQKVMDLLQQVHQDLLKRSEYESTSLVDVDHSFDTIVVVENYPLDIEQLTKEDEILRVTDYHMHELTNFDLTVSIECFASMKLVMMWPEGVFEETMVSRMSDHFLGLLDEMIADDMQLVASLSMMSQEEQRDLSQGGLQPEVTYPALTIHECFEQKVRENPEEIALTYGQEHMTYRQLQERVNRVAGFLQQRGVQPDSLVGVMLEPSFDMIAVLLGILKAGGAYVPIEPDFPEERVSFILEDSEAKWLITSKQFQKKATFAGELLTIEDFSTGFEEEALKGTVLPESDGDPSHLAYVIYTSGTTGRPKGVMIEHRNVIQLVMHHPSQFHFSKHDTWMLFHSYCFDMSVWEMYGALLHGGRLVIVPKETLRDTYQLVRRVAEEKVTVLNQTPSAFYLFQQVVEEFPDQTFALRLITFGGERLKPGLLQSWRKRSPETVLVNMYGITETTVHVTYKEISDKEIQSNQSAIGVSLPTYACYVLDAQQRLIPRGMQGELYVGGGGVARGYLNRPELNATRFIENPYRPGERLYRSGDLVCLLENGEMEYIRRIDHQVKIRGYRIETGEIEHHLQQHTAIKEAVVVAMSDSAGSQELCAYVVTHREISHEALRKNLGEKVPTYMIPAYFVFLKQIPLTANGKVDRKALPPWKEVQQNHGGHEQTQDDVESTVAKVWQDVLDLQHVGLHENFFDVGGNSLKMIRLLSRLRSTFTKEMTMTTLFRYPTIDDQASYYRGGRKKVLTHSTPIRSDHCDVAVVGMAARMPGASDVGEFWRNLQQGVESIRVFTEDELRQAGIPEEQLQSSNYVRAKGYLEDTDAFDHQFFDYGVKEAEWMDPQLRILHECAWEALEHAGESEESQGVRVGVYVGGSPNFHWLRSVAGKSTSSLDEFQAMLLNEKDVFATRLAYKLNLTGPAVTIQTACSTSLVAIEKAWSDLIHGQCDAALAGGVSVTYPTKAGYLYEEGMIHSPDGHCRAFDEEAAGTVGGNGVGVVLLKRLADAKRDGNTIYAVIKGAAVNNDGARKAGFTAPGVEGQAAVIQAAQQMAGVKPEEISYVETHGTGTTLGDPLEIEALTLAFGEQEPGRVLIGSVKTNIGHLDAAAGVAGLIKTVLTLYHRQVPPSLHYQHPNRRIDFGNNPFRVNTTLSSLGDGVIRAGVSSFGMGGTNAHVVLESAPAPEYSVSSQKRAWQLLTLSAKSEAVLEVMTENVASDLEKEPDKRLADVAYTLHVGRQDFPYRRVVVAKDSGEAIAQLRSVKEMAHATSTRPVMFLFSGQGSQYVNMARDLYDREPFFREQMDRGFVLLRKHLQLDVPSILYPSKGEEDQANQRLKDTKLTQPILFLVEYALATLLIHWGVVPQRMIGHSVGEYVAACVAGVMSFEDALHLVAVRGKLMQSLPTGAMLSVNRSEEEIKELLRGEVDLAVVNLPSEVVLSGPTTAIERLDRILSERGVKTRVLYTSHAFHSRMMDPILAPFEREVEKVRLFPPQIPYISNVTGTWIAHEQATSPNYWVQHLRGTVQFSKGLSELLSTAQGVCLEVGPGRVLSTFVQIHPHRTKEQTSLHLLRHPLDLVHDQAHLLKQIGRLWMLGGGVDWRGYYGDEKRQRCSLPTYPFEKNRFPTDPKQSPSPQSHRGEKRSNMDEWFYVPSWERSSLPTSSSVRTNEGEQAVWLLFIDHQNRLEALMKQLRYQGKRVIVVRQGEWFARIAEDSYTLHGQQKADYRELFADLERRGSLPQKILHAWSCHPVEEEILSEQRMNQAMTHGYYSLLYLAQALGKYEGKRQLYVLTEGMSEVTGTETALAPERATILGFTKICGLEFSSVSCRTLDMDQGLSEPFFIHAIIQECQSDASDLVVAYRGRHRWVPTVQQTFLEQAEERSPRLREGGTYLITGGLGGIGFAIARDLAQKVPGVKLILLGRSAFPARQEWDRWITKQEEQDVHMRTVIHAIREMESQGAEVFVGQGDVAQEADLHRVLSKAKERFGSIHGVVHAAGVADYLGILMNRDKEKNDAILAPKVTGTLLLDSLLKEEPLDFFVLCSSIGNIAYHMKFGQSGYSAANEFLDAFAVYKTLRDGIYTVSINWPDWQEVGMSLQSAKIWAKQLNTDVQKVLGDGVTVEEGVKVFQRIIRHDHPQVVASPVDLHWKLTEGVRHYTELLDQGGKNQPKQKRTDLLVDFVAPSNEIEQQLSELIQQLFGYEQVGIHDNFFDLGMSSLDLVRVNTKIKDLFQCELPVVTLYEHSSIHALAQYLSRRGHREESTSSSQEIGKGKAVMKNTLARLSKRQ
ncbi:hybrid non-ribosomal peptide synthetase/type I polyketide synthase [Marininema halotolerans]|uniref:Amino acid adenylation domain-containing protein n=1 Tax=Marininema halotolerans TaxID=1155944 RepID=A0A1I6PWG3_9BACL|nr:hybrid non-ribosomal peptide synthetase/type I polyketide synthase [Marininema halotolerans]SFS44420.1 amino acid adenylation domain-containing protein [Marininema halotolerans]